MKNHLPILSRSTRRFVGAALLLPLLGLPTAAQCGDDLWVVDVQGSAEYGRAVAVDGTWAAVGAPRIGLPGAVDVLQLVDGEWRIHQRLTTSSVTDYARFGAALAIDGTTLVVGAPEDRPGTPPVFKQGAVIVYELQGGSWVETARLEASDADEYDLFGAAVAIDGDFLAVGAYGDEAVGGIGAGSAYVFERSGTAWTEVSKVQPPGIGIYWYFGVSIDIDGTTMVVGATQVYLDQGSAFVFEQYGSQWLQQAELVNPLPSQGSNYGWDVSLLGDLVAVGHPGGWSVTLNKKCGLVHLWQRTGTLWSRIADIEPAHGEHYDRFGTGVVLLDASRLAVGALGEDFPYVDTGAVHVFEESGGVWVETARAGQCQPDANAETGSCIASDGTTILAGAPESDNMIAYGGMAIVLENLGGTWSVTDDLWDASVISLAAGGDAEIELDFGSPNAGRMFFVVGSTSGTTPGFNVLGQHIPLNYDFYTVQTAYAPNTTPLANSFGFTDGNGRATCLFTVPPGSDPILAGLTVTHCAVLVLPLDYVTKTDDILLRD